MKLNKKQIDIIRKPLEKEENIKIKKYIRLLLDEEEMAAMDTMRKAFSGMKADEAVENILNMFAHTKNNKEFCQQVRKTRLF